LEKFPLKLPLKTFWYLGFALCTSEMQEKNNGPTFEQSARY